MIQSASSRLILAGLVVLLTTGQPAQADLARYVKREDPAFAWKLKGKRELFGAKIYDLELTSQVWQSITWKHDILVVVPPKVEPTSTLFLWNQGGKPGVESTAMALEMARKMKAPACFLFGIPNQPLFDNLREDALIAETFVRYLKTRDGDWPLLFPMVKSLVKAMDALQAFAKQEWKMEVKDFVVSGASKRGWTTWLTAASDSRVKAIIPMVIDTLNMPKQMEHQLASYGAFSEMIRDYTRRKLAPPPMTPEGQKLWQMVDPWVYRDKIKVPKLILNGTNDPYWTQDALNIYWNDLNGDKWICYVPNAGHNLAQKTSDGKLNRTRAISTMSAFAQVYIHDKKLPNMSWKHTDTAGKHQLTVTSDVAPKAIRLWQADATRLDFRKSSWKEETIKVTRGKVTTSVEGPASGCRVFFAECEYDLDGLSYYLSTQLRIVGKPESK